MEAEGMAFPLPNYRQNTYLWANAFFLEPETPPYFYRAFGLLIESELHLPELPVSEAGAASVHIRLGDVPAMLDSPKKTGVRYQARPHQFLLSMEKIAHFLVTDGNSIRIQPSPGAHEEDIRLFLLGSVLGALLHQRKFLVLHASAVEYQNKGLVFAGISGVGKSTLVAGLLRQGCRLITDDVCAITFNEKKYPLIQPGFPQLKLWQDAILRMGDDPSAHRKLRKQIEKYGVSAQDNFLSQTIPVSAVCMLTTRNIGLHSCEEIKGIEKFTALRNNTYRFQFIEGLGLTQTHFSQSGQMAGKIRVFRLTRSLVPDQQLPFIDFLLQHLSEIVKRNESAT